MTTRLAPLALLAGLSSCVLLVAPTPVRADVAAQGPQAVENATATLAPSRPETSTEDPIERNVVKLIVTKRRPDLFRPWTKASPAKTSGSGVVLPDRRILTNAHVAMHASQIFVQLRQGGDQIAARVVALGPGIDLALVELQDPSRLDVPGLPLADALPETKSRVSAYGYPTGGDDLSVTDGIVSRIEFSSYYYRGTGVRVQVDAALNPGNSGGPAVQDGKIVGLVFSKIQEADNIGYLIPAEEIRRFLGDVSDGSYQGPPMLFDEIQTAENPGLRSYLEIPSQTTGVIITKPYRDDPDYPLRRWDLVTHIGPHSIDNQGYAQARPGLRLRYHYFVRQLASSGKVPLTLLRDGETLEIEAPVDNEVDRVIPLLKEHYPEYFIYGPFVFTIATQEYVGALGARGLALLASQDSPLLKRFGDKPSEPGEQIVVIATRSFPHPITKGYDSRPMGVVSEVNGQSVKHLRHLAELLRDNEEEYLRLDVAGRGESFVFRTDEIAAATEGILESEGIRYQASESLRDIWQP